MNKHKQMLEKAQCAVEKNRELTKKKKNKKNKKKESRISTSVRKKKTMVSFHARMRMDE